jgi:ribosome maturation factor RimP
LDDLEVVGRGPGTIVRVTVDGESPVGVDRIASLSRGIARIFDDEDPISGSYTLEVGSPGLERKLRRPEHFAKSIGREAKVKVKGAEGFETVRGIITSVDETGFEMKVDDTERRLEFSDVTSASTVYVWQKNPRPGSKEGR